MHVTRTLERSQLTPAYLPTLDGVRAVAILLVLVSHTVMFAGFAVEHQPALMGGYAGMCLFFVLSGYLITRLLLREEDRFGNVSLKEFYLRRAFRLFPALWLYLAVLLVFWVLGYLPELPWRSFVYALCYVRNLVGRGDETSHLWSLSLEEQFYLVWPVVFALLARRNGLRMAVAGVTILLVVAWRCYAWNTDLVATGRLYMRTDFRFDGPLIGCALALLERSRPRLVAALSATSLRGDLTLAAAVAAFVAWSVFQLRYGQAWGVDSTLVSLLSALLIAAQVGNRPGLGGRVLSWPPVVFLGKISYGVYLWQGLFMGDETGVFSPVRGFPWNLVGTFAAALLSFYLLERPLLRFKDRAFHRRTAAPQAALPPATPAEPALVGLVQERPANAPAAV
jgi:peptidoglycan/LPS O-acetylase OafA/YrhL